MRIKLLYFGSMKSETIDYAKAIADAALSGPCVLSPEEAKDIVEDALISMEHEHPEFKQIMVSLIE
jgi:hypothetical protein